MKPGLVQGPHVDAARVIQLLEYRAIPAGTVFFDEVTMLPIEPLCSWFRRPAYDDKGTKTLREYAYIVRRFAHLRTPAGPGCLRLPDKHRSGFRPDELKALQNDHRPRWPRWPTCPCWKSR